MNPQEKVYRIFVSSFAMAAVVGLALSLGQAAGFAQQAPPPKAPGRKAPAKPATTPAPAKAQPKYKGIWEPIPYAESVNFQDVFFVSPEVGYASGDYGTIVKTTDGGTTWTALAGGNPQSPGETISRLHFLDETHGWAVQGGDLLRTTDGETWEPWSRFKGAHSDYVFLSENVGVALGHPAGGIMPNFILRTQDGGKTWRDVQFCQGRLNVDGAVFPFEGIFGDLHFPTPRVGYATASTGRMDEPPILAKTEDGGLTWKFLLGPGAPIATPIEIFFLDENIGFVRIKGDRVFTTTDGGQSWRGLLASIEPNLRFTDPEVGWALGRGTITYTTDGGKRWSSFRLAFPVEMIVLSLPRRDRAYVVGGNGLIYRYRIVPIDYASKGMIAAPAMPGYDVPVRAEADKVRPRIKALQAKIQAAMKKASREPGGAPSGFRTAEPVRLVASLLPPSMVAFALARPTAEIPQEGGGFQQEVKEAPAESVPAAAWIQSCCAAELGGLETSVNSFVQTISSATGRYRNLNLILAGIPLFADILTKVRGVGSSLQAIKSAPTPEAAAEALNQLSSQLDGAVASADSVVWQ